MLRLSCFLSNPQITLTFNSIILTACRVILTIYYLYCMPFIKILTIVIAPILGLFAANSIQAQQLEVYLDYKRFSTPDQKGIFEIYLQINALSTRLLQDDKNLYSSKLEITELIKQGNKIVDFKKYTIESPKMADSMIVDFVDQQRFLLEPGVYELELVVVDLNLDSANKIETIIPFNIQTDSLKIYLSDIQALERYTKAVEIGPLTKSGLDIVPYVSNYYPPEVDKIAFYAELYNSNRLGVDEKLVMFQYIEDKKTGKQLSDFSKFSKLETKPIIPIVGVIDIKKLLPGDYNLVIEFRNKNNEIVEQKKWFFQRNNLITFSVDDMLKLDIKATFVEKIISEDSLNEFISSLRPIALPNEMIIIDTIVRSKDVISKRKFFYSFWLSRNGLNPEYDWIDYKKAVENVQVMFGTQIKKGYMTDRGAAFLKYGAPDYVYDKANEPNTYPYQIWQYKKIGRYTNKRFIFYLPDLVTNDYVLLHSEVPGEVKNYRWQQVLSGRTNTNTNIDDGSSPGQWGNNSNEMFRNPR